MKFKPHKLVAALIAASIGLAVSHAHAQGLCNGAYYFAEGSSQQFSTTFASAKVITALTNENPAVASCTGHGYTTDDEILLTSGWEDATDTVWRVTVLDANSFSIQGLDTTNLAPWKASFGAKRGGDADGFDQHAGDDLDATAVVRRSGVADRGARAFARRTTSAGAPRSSWPRP